MKLWAGAIVAAISFVSTLSGANAQSYAALPKPTQPVAATGDAKPLPAWTEYCRKNAADCAVDRSEAMTVTLTPKVWQTITSVSRRVNASIRPITDAEHWNVGDRWDLPEDGYGDCEDFQLLKRKLLAEAGLPRRAMRMTVVVDEKNEGHAVLMVRTDLGDFVLDNKTNEVLPWFETGYVFIKRESQESVGWVSLGGAVSPVATATR
jgi:predicted transglutaminase-like cysteine proteinase